jgi:hypothetical protein
MESFENHKLPLPRDRDATDPARIVRWAKEALTCGQAHPKVFEKYNLLRYCVSEEVRACVPTGIRNQEFPQGFYSGMGHVRSGSGTQVPGTPEGGPWLGYFPVRSQSACTPVSFDEQPHVMELVSARRLRLARL